MNSYFIALFLFCGLISSVFSEDDTTLEIPERKIAPICLRCICDAVSGCNKKSKCDGDSCGVFNMTRQYWTDAGRQEVTTETEDDFKQCASDFLCASGVVDDYVTKYKQNCDGIGRISCFDYAAIHLYGGENCKKVLPTKYKGRLTGCLGRILD